MYTNAHQNILSSYSKQVWNGPDSGRPFLKVAIDTHADSCVYAAMFDGSAPKHPRRVTQEVLLDWLQARQKEQRWQIVTCYEAGPMGFSLHRQLEAAGIRSVVIRPSNWDKQHRRTRHDRSDALSMLDHLDRYIAGQPMALQPVFAPTVEQEAYRQWLRMLRSLKKDFLRMAQRGRGYALAVGFRLKGAWFGPRRWPVHQRELPAGLVKVLAPLREVLLCLVEQIRQLQQQIQEQHGSRPRPVGGGVLTLVEIEAEVGDWKRFGNRRQVGSWSGLVPQESSSGPQRFLGSLTKCGNNVVRHLLVEAAWRLLRYQPDYVRVLNLRRRMGSGPGKDPKRLRKLVVGLAREFLIDLWRLGTGQTTPQRLGLRMSGSPVQES